MFAGFGDTVTNEDANEEACNFIRRKISQIVKDPAKAALLTPSELYVRRPPCDRGYYDKFNQDHVFAIDIKKHPIVSVEEKGLTTSDGKIHELDVIIFATGFDAVDGSYKGIKGGIKGRGGLRLSDYWKTRPRAYLGIFVPRFPNLFLINGPQTVFSNQPPSIETVVDFIIEVIQEMKTRKAEVIEATVEAETQWIELCDKLASYTLFNKVRSWITGANVDGRDHQIRFFYGGIKMYRGILDELKAEHYQTLKFSVPESSSATETLVQSPL